MLSKTINHQQIPACYNDSEKKYILTYLRRTAS